MNEVGQDIDAPANKVWRILIDTEAWPDWGPSVQAVQAPTRFISAGVRGRIRTLVGLWLPFEVTDWEPGRYWGWRVAGLGATGHRVGIDGGGLALAALRANVGAGHLGAGAHRSGRVPPQRRRQDLARTRTAAAA